MFDLFRSRDKVVRIMLGGLLGVVGLSMVTYLIPSSGTTGNDSSGNDTTVVANIGKETLTAQEVNKAVSNMTRSRQLPEELLSIYVPQIVQQMISERAMAYEASRLGMKVSSEEAENAILDTMPAEYVKNGKVDANILAALLQQQGVTLADMKTETARGLLVNRLRQIVGEGVVVSNTEITAEYHHRNDKIKVEYAVVAPEKYRAEAEPSEAEIKAWYDAHKAAFTVPEKRSLGIIVLDPAKISAGIQPSDADLHKEYTSEQDKFRQPERVMARHILIKSDASNDAAMKTKAEAILKMIQGGGDFAKIAKENSQDPGSADKGGDVGWMVRGQMVPEFEKAAFALKPGETSGLVKTTYGYHIIQVSQHEAAHLQTFDEVKPQLIAEYSQRVANERMQKLADTATTELRKDPLHPEKAAEAVGTTVVRAENIQAGDPVPEVGVSKEFNDAIAPLRKGEVTAGPAVLPGGKVVLASVTDYQAPHPATYEEAKAEARNKAGQDKLQAVVASKASALAARAQALGGDLQKAGKEMGIEIKTSTDVDRQGAIEGVGQATSLEGAFSKPVGSLIGPVSISGNQVVAKVVSQTPADISGISAQLDTIRTELKQQKARDRAQLFEDGLRKRLEQEGKLKVHQDVVTRLVKSYTTRS
jgi:peptidyl-prolyl cis-trans isomerase D